MGQIQIDIEATGYTVEDGDNAQSQVLSVLTTESTMSKIDYRTLCVRLTLIHMYRICFNQANDFGQNAILLRELVNTYTIYHLTNVVVNLDYLAGLDVCL
jgi:hypothetical protein